AGGRVKVRGTVQRWVRWPGFSLCLPLPLRARPVSFLWIMCTSLSAGGAGRAGGRQPNSKRRSPPPWGYSHVALHPSGPLRSSLWQRRAILRVKVDRGHPGRTLASRIFHHSLEGPSPQALELVVFAVDRMLCSARFTVRSGHLAEH